MGPGVDPDLGVVGQDEALALLGDLILAQLDGLDGPSLAVLDDAKPCSSGSTSATARPIGPTSSWKPVYSISPRIIPWLTSFWNGSAVLTSPRSKRTLCQNRL